MKKEETLKKALEDTGDGYLTIMVQLTQWKDFRKKHFDLHSKVEARTVKGKKLAPIVLVTAPDESVYIKVTRAIGNYSIVSPKGEFLPPAPAMS